MAIMLLAGNMAWAGTYPDVPTAGFADGGAPDLTNPETWGVAGYYVSNLASDPISNIELGKLATTDAGIVLADPDGSSVWSDNSETWLVGPDTKSADDYAGSAYNLYTSRDATHLYLGVRVFDDDMFNGLEGSRMDRSDMVQFYIEPDNPSDNTNLSASGLNPGFQGGVTNSNYWQTFGSGNEWHDGTGTNTNYYDNNEGNQMNWESAAGWILPSGSTGPEAGWWVAAKWDLAILEQTSCIVGINVAVTDIDSDILQVNNLDQNRTWFAGFRDMNGNLIFGQQTGDSVLAMLDSTAYWGQAVPEPVTLLGVFLGISSLGGYIRKRRTV